MIRNLAIAAATAVCIAWPAATGRELPFAREGSSVAQNTELLLRCSVPQSATIAVTISARGEVLDAVAQSGDARFLAPAIGAVFAALRPTVPLPTLISDSAHFVEMVTIRCVPPSIPPPPPSPQPPASTEVRVGHGIATPERWLDVAPIYPAQAREAGITGTVVVEVPVRADGTVGRIVTRDQQLRTQVTDVRVLRSVRLLDEAAVYAVRQWRYLPTWLNGVAVPTILTATVRFPD